MSMSRRELIAAGATIATANASRSGDLPLADFGPHKISRVIVGGNPISGYSHCTAALSAEMVDYFSSANVLKLLRDCEEAGINTWQSRGDRHIRRLLREYRLAGGTMHWIGQTASEFADIPANIRAIADAGAIAVYHHGSQTDRFWKAGKIEQAREMCKVMRDTGVRVGLATHIPEVIDYVEEKGWDLDFYMTCLYNLTRSKEEASKLTGKPVEGELFWDPDRKRMLDRVKQTARQCIIFKVYGAGRKCGSPEDMLDALRQVARYAKANDCVDIGMFPKHSEQVRENCRLFREVFAGTAA